MTLDKLTWMTIGAALVIALQILIAYLNVKSQHPDKKRNRIDNES